MQRFMQRQVDEGGRVSIHKTTSKRSPWRVIYRDADGRQRSRSFPTHKDAVAFDATIKTTRPDEREAPRPTPSLLDEINQADGSMLLRDWLVEWFTNYGPLWAPKTLKDRSNVAAKWITPFLGDIPVDQITARVIKRYRVKLAEAGASNNRINVATTHLSSALTAAREDGLIDVNPWFGQRKLPHEKRKVRPLTPLEVEAIRYVMPTPRDKIIISLIAYAGLRPAEVCGLTWAHISSELILVEQTIQEGEVAPTKTRRSRTVRILPSLAHDLNDYGRGAPGAFVVTGSKGGPLNWNIWEQRVFRPNVPDEGVVPYDLRHTFASLALHEGRSLPWIQKEMGHASPTTLLDHYAHEYEEAELATRVGMDDAVQAARNTAPNAVRRSPRAAGRAADA